MARNETREKNNFLQNAFEVRNFSTLLLKRFNDPTHNAHDTSKLLSNKTSLYCTKINILTRIVSTKLPKTGKDVSIRKVTILLKVLTLKFSRTALSRHTLRVI